MEYPSAQLAKAIVIIDPRSCAEICPTLLAPRIEITFPILVGTVEKPVSSMFQMSAA